MRMESLCDPSFGRSWNVSRVGLSICSYGIDTFSLCSSSEGRSPKKEVDHSRLLWGSYNTISSTLLEVCARLPVNVLLRLPDPTIHLQEVMMNWCMCIMHRTTISCLTPIFKESLQQHLESVGSSAQTYLFGHLSSGPHRHGLKMPQVLTLGPPNTSGEAVESLCESILASSMTTKSCLMMIRFLLMSDTQRIARL